MLIDDMFVEDGDEVPVEALLQPRVVVEIAFVMARDLAGPGVTTVDALTAIGGVLPAIEIVDSRIADWRVQLADTVADNASAGRVVLGSRITRPPPSTCAWPGCFCTATVLRWRAERVRPHWAIRSGASPGWPTGFSRPSAGCVEATSCYPDRCIASCRFARTMSSRWSSRTSGP